MDSKIRKSIEDKDFCTCASLDDGTGHPWGNHSHYQLEEYNEMICFCLKCKKVLRKDQLKDQWCCKRFLNKFEKTLYNY